MALSETGNVGATQVNDAALVYLPGGDVSEGAEEAQPLGGAGIKLVVVNHRLPSTTACQAARLASSSRRSQ